METLPPRLLLHVLEYLLEDDWLRVANVCQRVRRKLTQSVLAKKLTLTALQWEDAPLLRALLLDRKWAIDDEVYGRFVTVCRRKQTSLIRELLQTERFLDAIPLITRLAVLEAWPRAMRSRDAATLHGMLQLGWGETDRVAAELICIQQGYGAEREPLRTGVVIETERLTSDEEAMLLTKGGELLAPHRYGEQVRGHPTGAPSAWETRGVVCHFDPATGETTGPHRVDDPDYRNPPAGWEVRIHGARAHAPPWSIYRPPFRNHYDTPCDWEEVTHWTVETWRHRNDADPPMTCAVGGFTSPYDMAQRLALENGVYADPVTNEPWW